MPSSEVVIFANPIAGRGRGRVIARRLGEDLGSRGYAVRTIFDRPIDINPDAIPRNAAAAICVGGDGTLRSVVELLFAHGGEGPPLLPVPMGTANLMGRHLDMRWTIQDLSANVLATIERQKILNLDVARANGRLFMLVAGIGIDARIVHLLDQMRRGPIDLTSYVLPAAFTFAEYNFPKLTVTVDDEPIWQDAPAIAFVGNVKEYGTGFPILTEARPDDGVLDICVLPCQDRKELMELLLLIAAGEHSMREGVEYVKGTRVQIDSTEPVPVQIDGDSSGFTPLKIELLPGRVPFLVPA